MVHVDIDPATYAAVRRAAEAEDRTIKSIVKRAVAVYGAAAPAAAEEVPDES